jgi:hypothetical protein
MARSATDQEVDEVFSTFWKPLLAEDPRGLLHAVKAELFDYHQILEYVPDVYGYITGGMVSKPLTDPSHVKNFADEHYAKQQEEPDRLFGRQFISPKDKITAASLLICGWTASVLGGELVLSQEEGDCCVRVGYHWGAAEDYQLGDWYVRYPGGEASLCGTMRPSTMGEVWELVNQAGMSVADNYTIGRQATDAIFADLGTD